MTANNFAANAYTNSPVFQDLVNICGLFEKIFHNQAIGLPGYSNSEVNAYSFFITSTVSNGGLGGCGNVGNSSVKGWIANAAMVQLVNTFYSSVAQT